MSLLTSLLQQSSVAANIYDECQRLGLEFSFYFVGKEKSIVEEVAKIEATYFYIVAAAAIAGFLAVVVLALLYRRHTSKLVYHLSLNSFFPFYLISISYF